MSEIEQQQEIQRLRAALERIAHSPYNPRDRHMEWAAEALGTPLPPIKESNLSMHDIRRMYDS